MLLANDLALRAGLLAIPEGESPASRPVSYNGHLIVTTVSREIGLRA
jgi:hypothetical protein